MFALICNNQDLRWRCFFVICYWGLELEGYLRRLLGRKVLLPTWTKYIAPTFQKKPKSCILLYEKAKRYQQWEVAGGLAQSRSPERKSILRQHGLTWAGDRTWWRKVDPWRKIWRVKRKKRWSQKVRYCFKQIYIIQRLCQLL